eukprot:3827561-Pyramimonas_sp.AAC.1
MRKGSVGGSLVKQRRPRASAPTTERESRCTVRKGGTWFASLHRLPTAVLFKGCVGGGNTSMSAWTMLGTAARICSPPNCTHTPSPYTAACAADPPREHHQSHTSSSVRPS